MAKPKPTLNVQVTEQLYNHLRGLSLIFRTTEGRKVSVSELIRRAIVAQYRFSEVQLTPYDATTAAIMANENSADTVVKLRNGALARFTKGGK